MRHVWFPFLACAALSATAAGAAVDPKTSAGERTWTITDYIKGTAPQIRDQVNAEEERLIARYRAARADRDKAAESLAAAKAEQADRLARDPARLKLQADLKRAEAERDALRADGTPEQRLAAATELGRVRQALDAHQKKFLAADTAVTATERQAKEADESIATVRASIGQAQQWRTQIIDVVRNTYAIEWPLARGSRGLLNTIVPTEVVAGRDAVVCPYVAAEEISEKASGEGFASVTFRPHHVTFLVTGPEMRDARKGEPITLNGQFEVFGADVLAGEVTYLVRRAPGDVDQLMAALLDLRAQIDPKELESLSSAAAVPKKANPKRWPSLQALLAAIPATRRPAVGRSWDEVSAGKANEWLGAECAGDRLDCAAVVRSVDPVRDGFFVLKAETEVPLPNGRGFALHEVEAKCPADALPKVKHLKAGQKTHVGGTIRTMRLMSDGTAIVDLVDAAP